MKKIAIIGSGLSGLTTSNLLKDIANITVFEKARGVGGRMSTRRAHPYYFDHGAQYFTVRTKEFKDFINPSIENGLIQKWNTRYVKFNYDKIIEVKNPTNEDRYVCVPGMNAFAKYLSTDLNIKINTKISTLNRDKKWKLYDDNKNFLGDYDWVISTSPSPQASDLLPKEFKYYNEVASTKMTACFSLMIGFEKPLNLSFDAAHIINSDISWIAVNSKKPGRSGNYSIMIHSSCEYAEKYIDDNREKVINHMCLQASKIIGHDICDAEYINIHPWRYSNNYRDEKLPVLIDYDLQLASCGDWCEGGRVEGAFTSAYNMSEELKKILL